MELFWIASEASLPEGPFTAAATAREAARSLSVALCEPVTVFSGPTITRWSRMEDVRFSEL